VLNLGFMFERSYIQLKREENLVRSQEARFCKIEPLPAVTSRDCRQPLPAPVDFALLLGDELHELFPFVPQKKYQIQRAAAAPVSSGRVLKAIAAFGAAR
jgi:hypothetical protein